MDTHPTARELPAQDRHTEFNLPTRLLIDDKPYTYDPYLNAWTNGLGVELSGWTIMHGMSLNLRVEVAR
ncbi:hypothetical protein LXM50_01655 [Microbacterium sp. Au-Mic1]|uniref:hypothetical protein n=1 Tax=Microbacterium sp. Au-Mic1 TaxID=2906457 RepID=UPI001E537B61|nr:hypothetical protein [Microbacterium sp. Au-Mic1]MCE4024672.1 hypothetical protein [Microbacterium sp. Au-Mic1]